MKFFISFSACIGSHWGQGCTIPCGHCNTSFCDKRDGMCECQTGWAAPNCTGLMRLVDFRYHPLAFVSNKHVVPKTTGKEGRKCFI